MKIQTSQRKVSLRPMSEDEYRRWYPVQTAAYAASKVKSGNWSEEESLGLASKQMQELLTDGLNTKGHSIFSITNQTTNEVVGALWVNVKDGPRGPYAFIYDIEIDEQHRGKGFGSTALTLLEERLRHEGVKSLRLHVFGYNTDAQRLYVRQGFEVTNINMEKSL